MLMPEEITSSTKYSIFLMLKLLSKYIITITMPGKKHMMEKNTSLCVKEQPQRPLDNSDLSVAVWGTYRSFYKGLTRRKAVKPFIVPCAAQVGSGAEQKLRGKWIGARKNVAVGSSHPNKCIKRLQIMESSSVEVAQMKVHLFIANFKMFSMPMKEQSKCYTS